MSKKTHLYVLWTNDNPITAEKMVFMYTVNSLIHGWWEKVTLIIWGATAQLVSQDANIQKKVKEALDKGVHITACKACTEQLGVTEALEKLNKFKMESIMSKHKIKFLPHNKEITVMHGENLIRAAMEAGRPH